MNAWLAGLDLAGHGGADGVDARWCWSPATTLDDARRARSRTTSSCLRRPWLTASPRDRGRARARPSTPARMRAERGVAASRSTARVTTACPANDPTTESAGHRGGRQPEPHRRHARASLRARAPARAGRRRRTSRPPAAATLPATSRRDRTTRHGTSGATAAPLDQDEDRHQHDGGRQRGHDSLRDRQDEEHERRGHARRAGHVEGARPGDVTARREQPRRRHEQQDADRQVDQEDPLPAPQLRDRPAEQQPGGAADAADPAPDRRAPGCAPARARTSSAPATAPSAP